MATHIVGVAAGNVRSHTEWMFHAKQPTFFLIDDMNHDLIETWLERPQLSLNDGPCSYLAG